MANERKKKKAQNYRVTSMEGSFYLEVFWYSHKAENWTVCLRGLETTKRTGGRQSSLGEARIHHTPALGFWWPEGGRSEPKGTARPPVGEQPACLQAPCTGNWDCSRPCLSVATLALSISHDNLRGVKGGKLKVFHSHPRSEPCRKLDTSSISFKDTQDTRGEVLPM